MILLDKYDETNPPTLVAFMKNRDPIEKVMPMMVIVEKKSSKTAHALAVHFDYIADNHTMKPIHISEKYKYKTAKVVEAYMVG